MTPSLRPTAALLLMLATLTTAFVVPASASLLVPASALPAVATGRTESASATRSGRTPIPPTVPAVPGLPSAPEPGFTWPLTPVPQVTKQFDAPDSDYGPGHRGVDLAAAPGQQVLAAGPGVVVFAGQVAGQGVVSVDHDGGLRTTYEPVTPLVAAGTQVSRGQPVATLNPGHPDCPATACLHWGVRRGDEYLNPLGLIQTLSVIRLKPWIAEPP